MDMTPTRCSKRSCESSYSSLVARSQHKIQKIPKGLKVRASNERCTVDYNSDELLHLCIRGFALASTSYFNEFLQFDTINYLYEYPSYKIK